ncbi:NFACT RNA binding domain-containing protein [Desulfovibrio subterraneus]|uniref:NFACT RNA binding domain-containing protein n=1 Tax=Desulfovibrio subterraneus TaxID=2718620 RepID=UPI0022B88A81|nr:NFACT RNA binding domain-containing protein [Desulfovibrio subterraneus]WBF67752.1 NFACT RNA binding domain-containing protein [Desulfovibrio subterraneus]
MDAHVFRRLAAELAQVLTGSRIERFYAPAPDITTIVLYAAGLKQNLLLRAGRRFPLLLLTPERPENPASPAAHAMWLRKHAGGRRLGAPLVDWVNRRMAVPLSGSPVRWLVLCLREGVTVTDTLEDGFGSEPAWPDHARFASIHEGREVWAAYPQYTPLLRETLAELAETDPMDAQALLADLEYGPGDCTADVYLYSREDVPEMVSVWPLPAACAKGMTESVVPSAMEAVRLMGTQSLFGGMVRQKKAEEAAPANAAIKRLRKTLHKLDSEERRLSGMVAGQADALAIQAELWRIGADSRLAEIEVTLSDGSVKRIALDSLRTVRGNMERMFHQAMRGKRGLGMLNERRDTLRSQIDALEKGELEPDAVLPRKNAGGRQKGRPEPAAHPDSKLYQRFRSSDGFLMLRGRNAKGNHEILNKAMPHDLWFHAEDGPSAHLVLRLEFPGQEVPERTMIEAAQLVGVKSWQRDGGQARVMCAVARHVRKVKGAAVGAVHVGRMERSLLVDLGQDIEKTLAVDAVL